MTINNVAAPLTHEEILDRFGQLSRAEVFRPASDRRLPPVRLGFWRRLLWRWVESFRCDQCGRRWRRTRAVVSVSSYTVRLWCPGCAKRKGGDA